jgi:predicted TIM-barrel fold metal-dependent hydrolase
MAKRTGRSVDASPHAHETHVANVAEKFVVVTVPRMVANVPNDFVADYVARFPGRAIGLACVDPNDPGAPAEFERAITKRGMRGLKLGPVYQNFDPWSREAWRLYEMANAFKVPILWHQASAFPAQGVFEYANPGLLDKVARAFPEMKMILAHLGTPWMAETVQLLRKHKQLYSDLSARFYRKWELFNGLMLAIDYKVTGQLLFGSDFPMQSTRDAADSFRELVKFAEDTSLPRIGNDVIDDILYNRPLELIWPTI